MEGLRQLRMERGLSQAKLAARANLDPSTVNQVERGAREASPATLLKLADALDIDFRELLEAIYPKAPRRSSLEPSLLNGLEDERRAEATGRSTEERTEISDSLAEAVENLSTTHRGALENLLGASAEEIMGLFLQANLVHIGAKAIAEDAGYSIDAEGDSAAEREAKIKMRGALDMMEQVADEIEEALTEAEAEQELPEGVRLFARYQRRRAS